MRLIDVMDKLHDLYGMDICNLSDFQIYSFFSDYLFDNFKAKKELRDCFFIINMYGLRHKLYNFRGTFRHRIKKNMDMYPIYRIEYDFTTFRKALYFAVFIENSIYYYRHYLFYFIDRY